VKVKPGEEQKQRLQCKRAAPIEDKSTSFLLLSNQGGNTVSSVTVDPLEADTGHLTFPILTGYR
jgi:hypothetical protein